MRLKHNENAALHTGRNGGATAAFCAYRNRTRESIIMEVAARARPVAAFCFNTSATNKRTRLSLFLDAAAAAWSLLC